MPKESTSRFIVFHVLRSYPPSSPNRDDSGRNKSVVFGGVTRGRLSSQHIKYSVRTYEGEHGLVDPDASKPGRSVRSRHIFSDMVMKKLLEAKVPEDVARQVTLALIEQFTSTEGATEKREAKKAKAKNGEGEGDSKDKDAKIDTNQLVVFGPQEVEYLFKEAEKICNAKSWESDLKARIANRGAWRKNMAAMTCGAGVDAACMGRMATSDLMSNVPSAVAFSHAITVGPAAVELDYYSSVDSLADARRKETGALEGSAFIDQSEVGTGIFYHVVVVDVPVLVSNTTGCARKDWATADLAVARRCIESIAWQLFYRAPGAKNGSSAVNYVRASALIVEEYIENPDTYSNAFCEALRFKGKPILETAQALAQHIRGSGKHGRPLVRLVAAIGEDVEAVLGPLATNEKASGMEEILAWIRKRFSR